MTSLPRTFRDAIVVTRSMGIIFLWIDSLCILQDSAEDWASESSRIGDYFANCLFIIAAADAADAD